MAVEIERKFLVKNDSFKKACFAKKNNKTGLPKLQHEQNSSH